MTGGGQPLLWQHLFWMFGHPWVYIIVLPAMGMVSDALPVFCRRPLVGYTLVVLATVSTMVLGFGVWVHHMFATGLPPLASSFFSGASFVITIPSAVSRLRLDRDDLDRPASLHHRFCFFAGFIFMFVIGGVSGVMTAVGAVRLAADRHLFRRRAHPLRADRHQRLRGASAASTSGSRRFTGRMLDERLGQVDVLDHVHRLQPRVLPDAHHSDCSACRAASTPIRRGLGWDTVNLVSTIGAFVLAHRRPAACWSMSGRACDSGAIAGDNPWDAPTLEWATTSPPPPYNFAVIPVVASRHPLWEDRLGEGTGKSAFDSGLVLDNGKETVATTVIDAEPDLILRMPHDSVAPFVTTLAMSVFFTGMLINSFAVMSAAVAAILLCLLWWLWPRTHLKQRVEVRRG